MSARITSITGLQNLTGLVNFYADWNSLTSVNLSNLTNLIDVDISDQNDIVTDENCLTYVNLSGCTALEQLRLDDNDFSAGIPNLSGLTSLQYFDMDQCSISGTIDISAQSFNNLTGFDLSGNSITSIILPEANLSDVNLGNNALIEESVNNVLQWLAGSGVENGYVDLEGGTSAPPTDYGLTAITTLQGRGWSVDVNQASTTIAVNISTIANCGQVATSLSVELAGDFCALSAPHPTITGDFVTLPSEFYVIYNGQSRVFVKVSDTQAEGIGGAPGECTNC